MTTRAPALVSLLERPASTRRIGPFFLVEEIGAGGYAPVWLAREMYGQTELRLAAVKLFALDALGADRDNIIEEARALGRVAHPHVAQFYALAIDEPSGVMGLAMELLRGRSLENRLMTEQKLSLDDTLSVGIAIASALAAVHRAGIVHRDVKPSNIVEESPEIYKLIDFGIARASVHEDAIGIEENIDIVRPGQTSPEQTMRLTGVATGTPGYIDPACFSGQTDPSVASDVYALGATLYRCLSGLLPAQVSMSDAPTMLLDPLVLSGDKPAPSLALRVPAAPPALARLVDLMLAAVPDARPRSAAQVEHALEQIRQDLDGRVRRLPPEDDGPFRGLRRFEASDRGVFFSRKSEMTAALTLLRQCGLVALVGPSGSGKSSLARAALLPALAEGALAKWPKHWDVVIIEPGRDPYATMTLALEPFVPDARSLVPEEIVHALTERAATVERGLVLFVDQLEELVTTAISTSCEAAAELLVRIGQEPTLGLRAIVAARLDLLDPLLAHKTLGKTMARGLCLVEPLRSSDWRDSVTQALEAYGYEWQDDALEEELFREIDQVSDAMPLVEFALAELWKARDKENKRLTRKALEHVGGIEGALDKHAEETMAGLLRKHPDMLDVTRDVLLALTTPEGTRRAQSEEELVQLAGERARQVIATLSAARLLVPSKDGVTVAHEALLGRWTRLRHWIAEAREDRILAEEIERDAVRWQRDAESVGLWTGRRLGFARELVRKNTIRLSDHSIAFVRASSSAHRRKSVAMTMVAMVIAMAIVGAVFMYVSAQRDVVQAQRQRLDAERVFFERIEEVVRNSKDKDSKLEELGMLLAERKKEDVRPLVATSSMVATSTPVAPLPVKSIMTVRLATASSASVPALIVPQAPVASTLPPVDSSIVSPPLAPSPPPLHSATEPATPHDLATKPREEF